MEAELAQVNVNVMKDILGTNATNVMKDSIRIPTTHQN